MFNFLTSFGNQNLLIKVTHNNRITSYGLFVETQLFNNVSLQKEYEAYISIIRNLLEENKDTLIQMIEADNDEAGEFLRTLTFRGNDVLRETHQDCLETRNRGFLTNNLQENEFEVYTQKRDIHFTDVIEFTI